jgi:hypothetical protein
MLTCLNESTIALAYDPVASVEQVARLPANHQNLLKFLVKFLRKITPEKTLMDTSNLATAFCTCFFGSRPQSDLSTELNNRTKEKQFLMNILTQLSCEDMLRPTTPPDISLSSERESDVESSMDIDIESLSESEASEPSMPPSPRNAAPKPLHKTLENLRASESPSKHFRRLSTGSLHEQLKIESISNELLGIL